MLHKLLNAKHEAYDADLWGRYDALYRGGKTFRARIGEFLPQNEFEPSTVYAKRKKAAKYRSYVGPIVDYFAAELFGASLEIRANDRSTKDPVDVDEFYADLKEDVDGAGTDLVGFLDGRFKQSLVKGRAWWRVELPDDDDVPAESRADWGDRGLGDARLVALDAEHVLDWERDEQGQLVWAVVHSCERPRKDPRLGGRDLVRETWRIFDRTHVETFQIEYDPRRHKLGDNDDIPSRGSRPHGFASVPLICLEPPEGLWLLDRAGDAQCEHFEQSAALGWALRRNAYVMPVFKVEDPKRPPAMGTGYYIMIGVKEDVEWGAPPSTPFEVLAAEVKSQKDEIYRVAQQMAAGVENNAAAVGRSGESKAQDASATETCLVAYGAPVREAVEKTFELIAKARGDEIAWDVSGLDKFNLADAATTVANATQAELLNIPSRTFRKKMFGQVVETMLPRLDQTTKDTIHEEIEEGVESEGELRDAIREAGDEAKLEAIETGAMVPGMPAPKAPPPNAKATNGKAA